MPDPGLYPRNAPRPTSSEAERRVWAALKKSLPPTWFAYHSLRIRDRFGTDGEGDFVVAVPERGLLVIEVKGGEIELRDGRWFQNGREMHKAPRDQGHSYLKKLLSRMTAHSARVPSMGIVTCFPDTAFDGELTNDDMRGLVIGPNELAWLGDALPAIADKAFLRTTAADDKWLDVLHSMWGETWVPKLRLGARADVEAVDRIALDTEQLAVLDLLEDTPRVLIDGEAGSGKTLVARELVHREIARGRRVLYLCFTDALATEMRAKLPPAADAMTISSLLLHLFERAGVDAGDRNTPRFWDDLPARALKEAFGAASREWDTLVVDEAQDFTDDAWIVIGELAHERRLWAFRSTQQAFWAERFVPMKLFSANPKLRAAYRCPKELLALANAYRGEGAVDELAEAAIAAERFIVSELREGETNIDRIARVLSRLIADGFAPRDIAVISLRGQTPAGSVARRDEIGAHRVVRADAADANQHVVADTFLRFKGLERAAIVIADTELVEREFGVRMYIAITRATSLVVGEGRGERAAG